MNNLPLIVDLDGTLICTDMLHESTLRILRDKPFDFLAIPYWLSQGKAVLKRNLSNRTAFDASTLPYNQPFLGWLKQQRLAGRKLVLCTASDHVIAQAIADHLGIFDEVMASDGKTNLAGKHKAEALWQRYGHAGFDYAGNSKADLAVWACARQAIVVNASVKLAKKAAELCMVEQVYYSTAPSKISTWRKVLRVHQWMKNALLFVPLLAAHQINNSDAWVTLFFSFFSFSLCASSVYIVNDLLDLESDRQHPRKCNRPFASGAVPVFMGVMLAPLLLMVSIALATICGGHFMSWLCFYFVVTCAYSWRLKSVMLLDCLTLAMLYTLRIIAGAAAISLGLSFWLLAFSVFLFLSLAFVKRYAELEVQLLDGKLKAHGRGYFTSDAPILQTMGISAGYSAVLVLAFYLNSDVVISLYKTPEIMWGTVPITLFWISWMWMTAHRGKMHDDPLVFAVKDKASLIAGVAFASVLAMGAVGWPW